MPNGQVLFVGNDGKSGNELWISDGRDAGTRQVVDLVYGQGPGPQHLTLFDGRVIFTADEDAYLELLDLWLAEGGGDVEGVLHCYTHTETFARRALDAGLCISFSGILTFKRDRGLRAVAAALPLDRLLVETDAPLLAPEGFRGKRNEPAHVVRVGEALAAAHERPLGEVAETTRANARRLFRLPD